jgi:hypothetical protein
MKFVLLIFFIIFTFSLAHADTRAYDYACTQIAFDMISEKVNHVQDHNSYVKSLDRLDKSLSEFSKRKPQVRKKMSFRELPPVFNHSTDVMTVNYMSRVYQMIQKTQEEGKKITIKNVAFKNLAAEYKKLIPKYMNNCVNNMILGQKKCRNAKGSAEKIAFCYSDKSIAIDQAKIKSPFFSKINRGSVRL